MNARTWPFTAAVSLVLLFAGCTPTLLASKEGHGYHLGSTSDSAYQLFCTSGDLKRILDDTGLDSALRTELFDSGCGPERSGERTRQVYARMSREQRKDLRTAFRRHGYDINRMHC